MDVFNLTWRKRRYQNRSDLNRTIYVARCQTPHPNIRRQIVLDFPESAYHSLWSGSNEFSWYTGIKV